MTTMQWLRRQLLDADARELRPWVVLDPDHLVDRHMRSEVEAHWGQVWVVHDYVELRRAWEAHGRRPEGPAPLFWVQSADFTSAWTLPWDIEQAARVVRLRWPVPPRWQRMARGLPPAQWDCLADAAVGGGDDGEVLGRFLTHALDAPLPQKNLGRELISVVRLHLAGMTAPALWEEVRPWLRGPLAIALGSPAPAWNVLQEAWDDWVRRGETAPHAATLEAAGAELTTLFAAGLLRAPAARAVGLPPWTRLGTVQPSAYDRAEALLPTPPTAEPPTTAGGWLMMAAWWGDLRSVLASGPAPAPEELAGEAAAIWTTLDMAFSAWIRGNYGRLFSAAASYPLTLDRVAAFLAKRHRQTGEKQLLVVLDGMGWAQWAEIRRTAGLTVAESAGCFAMVPTVTTVSRQAIFAGAPPWTFPQSILTTAQEPMHWRKFWVGEGVDAADVAYYHTPGATAADVPALGRERIAAVVVMAVDDIVHGAHLLGDQEVGASLTRWLAHGFLHGLVARAAAQGFSIWITSDHGNVEMEGAGRVPEGKPLSETTSARVRLYPSAILRDTANAPGIAWDPPGLPSGHYPLFAPGKFGYFNQGRLVSHGGLSLDEVIVPLVRVAP